MSVLQILSDGIMLLASLSSLACIVKFLQKQYRNKPIYQGIIFIQIVNIGGATIRAITKENISNVMECFRSFCTDFVLIGVVLVDLNILCLFKCLDDRINIKFIQLGMIAASICALYLEITFDLYSLTGFEIFNDVNHTNKS